MAERYKWTKRADGTYRVQLAQSTPKYDVTVTTVKPTVIRPKVGELPIAGDILRIPDTRSDSYLTGHFVGMPDDKTDIMDFTIQIAGNVANRSMHAYGRNWVKAVDINHLPRD